MTVFVMVDTDDSWIKCIDVSMHAALEDRCDHITVRYKSLVIFYENLEPKSPAQGPNSGN